MTSIEQRLAEFFTKYQARINRALTDPPEIDIEATVSAFADCFIEANPNGVVCGKNDEQLRNAIPKGFEFYRSIGTKSMKIASLKMTPLDEWHTMVKAHWEAFYKKKDGSGELIDFDVIYFVQTIGDSPNIFGYIAGDELRVYKERGLIPG